MTRNARLFDTRSLNGWKGDTKTWKAENGFLIGDKGQLGYSILPKGNYTLSFHICQTGGDGGIDILFPAGGGTLTWHLGSEAQGYSELREDSSSRSAAVLFESVWVRVTIVVSGGARPKAEGRIGDKTIWKLDELPVVENEPALGFRVDNGVFRLGRIFLKEAR